MDLDGGWAGLATWLGTELEEECRNRPRVCYALLRRDGAEASPGCRIPGVFAAGGSPAKGSAASMGRSAVNLALGMHGLEEAFTLTCVMDEETCSQVRPKTLKGLVAVGLRSGGARNRSQVMYSYHPTCGRNGKHGESFEVERGRYVIGFAWSENVRTHVITSVLAA